MSRPIDIYVVVVTDGIAPEYPPEIYATHTRASLEAERWAWILSGTGWLEVDRPFDGRWVVGDRDVRLVRVGSEEGPSDSLWVGQYWTTDGVPEPEALILRSRSDALAWVLEAPFGVDPATETIETPWFVSATYRFADKEAYAVASLAKFIRG